MSIMNIPQALDLLRKSADLTTDLQASNSLWDIYGVISRAPATQAATWSGKVKSVISYVSSGHYCGNYEEAKKILNKRFYGGRERDESAKMQGM